MVLSVSAVFPSRQFFIVCHTANTFAVLILPDCELFFFSCSWGISQRKIINKQTKPSLCSHVLWLFSEVLLGRRGLNCSWMGKLSWINTFRWVEISELFSGRKCIDTDPSKHLKTMSKALSTGNIWPIMKVIYLASSLPERKHANGFLFDNWFQWKHYSFLN